MAVAVVARRIALAAALIAAAAATPAAQTTTSGAARAPSSPPKWELEGYGGVSLGRFSSGGEASLPPTGAPITTSSPVYPSWSVPSWFFGDGAQFLNNVSEQFGLAARITPLDAALTSLGLNDAGGGHAGVRLRRNLSGAYGIEAGVDFMLGSPEFTSTLLEAATASRESFEATWASVLSTGPFANPVVSSSGATSGGASREVAVTAALTWEPFTGAWVPFVLAGGGVIFETGDLPALEVTGRYRFAIGGTVPVDETDRVTLRYAQQPAPVFLVGGGIRHDISPRWGLRIDARVLMGANPTELRLDATPAIVTATPAGFIESFTYPNLQVSNNASTGRRSTLGAPALEDFEAFTGGFQARVRVSVGAYVRF
jgi:hypothetical protein